MAQRRYQSGHLSARGKRRKMWVIRWREPVIRPDGTLGRVQRSEVLGPVGELPKREARKLLEARLRPLNQGRHRPPTALTLEQFVRDYWEPAVRPLIRQTTLAVYQMHLRAHVLPRFGQAALGDVSRAELQRFLANKLNAGLSSNYVHMIKATLGSVFTTAVQLELLDRNPAREVRLGPRENVTERVVFTRAQSDLLLAGLPEPCRTYVHFALLTWLRPGEQFALRWKNADPDKGVIRVRETYVRKYKTFNPPKTKPSVRDVPMSEAVANLLRLQPRRDGESLVFYDSVGAPVHWGKLNSRVLRPVCERLGLPVITWHALRHAGATLAADAGVPHRTIQALLGHGSSATTDLYVHSVTESEQAGMNAIGRMFPSVPTSLETETGKTVN